VTRLPQLTAPELVRFLKGQGFIEDRQSGSHLTMWHEQRMVAVTIPIHSVGGYWPGFGGANP